MLEQMIVEWIETNKAEHFTERYQEKSKVVFNWFWRQYKAELEQINKGREKKDCIKEASWNFLRSEWERIVGDVMPRVAIERKRAELAFAGESDDLDRLLDLCLEDPSELHKAVFRHWLWCVKRKIFDKPLCHHLMVMLFGEQEDGKTSIVTKLLAPIADWVLNWKLSQAADTASLPILADNYVVFCDEMAKPEKCDVDTLKNLITTEWVNCRKFYSQSEIKSRQRCVFIGCSNKPLDTLVLDSTGMRRFFQLNTRKQSWHDIMATGDALKIWQSIDENRAEGYLVGDLLAAVRTVQKELAAVDPIEWFVEHFNLLPEDGGETAKVSMDVLWNVFQNFAHANGFHTSTSASFGKLLPLEGKKVGQKRARIVNANHTLGEDYAIPKHDPFTVVGGVA